MSVTEKIGTIPVVQALGTVQGATDERALRKGVFAFLGAGILGAA